MWEQGRLVEMSTPRVEGRCSESEAVEFGWRWVSLKEDEWCPSWCGGTSE